MTDITSSRDLAAAGALPPLPAGRMAETAPSAALPVPERAAWAAVVSLAFGSFGLVTAEFLPVSLLTPIAQELGATHGAVGQAVTATASVATFAGPLLVLGSGRLDRRLIVWGLTALLIVSSIVSAMATSIEMLLVSRALLGFGIGGFWAMMTALALRLVPSALVPRAMSVIIMGVSVATVFAAPLGAFLGELVGWRATFLAAAGVGLLTLAVQFATLPRLPAAAAPGLATFRTALTRPSVLIGYGTVLLAVSGHFAGFTFIRPFLEEVPRLDVSTISLALLAFGVGGFAGNIAAGAVAEKSPALAAGGTALLVAAATLALVLAGPVPAVAFAATAVWGFAFAGFPVSISIWNARSAPDVAESAGALLASSFQIAIASGAVIGGVVIDGFSPTGVIVYAALAALAGALVMLVLGRAAERRGLGG